MAKRDLFTRRDVLKAGAAALAAPYLVSRSVLGSPGRASANERITLGLIGVGNMGSGHVGGFLGHGDVQVVAICDVDRTKREKAQQQVTDHYGAENGSGQYAGCEVYNEFETLLARDDIDAVLIAVPDHWHAIIAITACRAGKDVYCEKPLSLTIHDGGEMVRAARRYARVFQTGSQQRSSENFRYACELVRSGRIGTLKTVNVGIGGPSGEKFLPEEPIREGFDWQRWLGPAPWKPYNAERCSGRYSGGWRLIRDYSGGMMTDWGAHHFDIAQWGMGMDGSGPIEITPPSEQAGTPLTYRYANGVTMVHGGANGVLFTGTEGKVEVNRGYIQTWPESIGRDPIRPNEVHLYESPGHRQDWLNCIRTRRRPICDVEIGYRSVSVCHLGNISWWLGQQFKWDPQREAMIGDPSAADWLSRPKRAPWRLHL